MQGICLSMPLSGVNSQDAFLAVPLSALILHDVSVCFYRVSQDVSVCLQRVSVCKPSLCLCLRLTAHEVVVPLLFLSYFAGHLSLSLLHLISQDVFPSLSSHFECNISVCVSVRSHYKGGIFVSVRYHFVFLSVSSNFAGGNSVSVRSHFAGGIFVPLSDLITQEVSLCLCQISLRTRYLSASVRSHFAGSIFVPLSNFIS